jgi:Zn-dependent M28 family amino/carboxypeptidase
MRRYIVFFLAAASLTAADYAAEGKLWWAHIQFLADDKLEGRNTGTEGYRQAVAYVAGKFETFGLQPGGLSGYEQPIKFETRTLVEGESSVALIRDGKTEELKLGAANDVQLNSRGEAANITAPMVFVGYGMVIPEAKYDDLAGVDLKGKIAVFVNAAGPVTASGNLKSHYSSGVERWFALKRKGAVGIAIIANPRLPTPNPPPPAASRGGTPVAPLVVMSLAEPDLRENSGEQVALAINRTGGEKFFAGSGHTFESIQKAAAANEPLPGFPLAVTAQVKTAVKAGVAEAPNVVGILPGSDPKLKDEYVVFSAHLDHLGTGRPVNGDNLYNGAMDNASGVASVLEVARLFKESGAKTKRSIIFLTVAGEEKGELGSRYFAARPTVPFSGIVADINLDMFLPLYGLKVLEVQGLAESTLGDEVRVAAKSVGVEVQTDREPDQNRFIRSDQYSFIRRGVPSLAFKFGYEFGSPEEKTRTEWVKTIYHKPADDLNQPIDKDSAAKFDRIIFDLIQRIANNPDRPKWKDDSFFRRFALDVVGGLGN